MEPLTNKMEAVRRVLQDLGMDASPIEIQEQVKVRYGLEMSAKMASVYKSKIARKGGRRGRRGRKPKEEGAVVEAAPRTAVHGGVSFRDLRTLRELNDRLGHAHLRELVELIAT